MNDSSAQAGRKFSVTLALALAVVGVLALGLWLAWRPAPDQVQGLVDARELRVASKVTGRLAQIHVEEGQMVEAGQLLATIDSPEARAKEAQVSAVVDAAEAQASKAEAGSRATEIAAAEAQWLRAAAAADLARVTFERINRLAEEGVVPGQKRDEARTNLIAADQAARAARAQYDTAREGARREDRRAAEAQASQARGAAAEVAAALAETTVFAPARGEVGRRLAQPGELVGAGFPIMYVTEIQRTWVTLTLRENQLAGIAPGSEVTGTIPALKGASARFRVTFMAPAGDYATWRATRQSSGFDIKGFEVRLAPVKPIKGLRPGMSVLFDWPQ
ncbi:HlyD family secretion protein [Erythrobacter sp. WG]|uniref:HlyD family secretion protein n=1 Tax=Erythrobacter sp. WG TaxID=2985510 RepID=UPI00226F8027|nr:efflux RND transporter periplasmic adaptor subunit [Erythrobacter sp. WG]MCX9147324.1 efflux RND transporter periplasmic adaptor subunit [Erythrobacter sp. WG]